MIPRATPHETGEHSRVGAKWDSRATPHTTGEHSRVPSCTLKAAEAAPRASTAKATTCPRPRATKICCKLSVAGEAGEPRGSVMANARQVKAALVDEQGCRQIESGACIARPGRGASLTLR